MVEVRRLAAEQKEEKEKAAKQKKAMQDKAVERVAQLEKELVDDGFNDTPLPRPRRIAGKSSLQFADRGESNEDDVSGPNQPGSDVIDDNDEVVIAKLDGTTNEVAGVNIRGFPTLIFYPAGENAQSVPYNGGRDFESLKKRVDEALGITDNSNSEASSEGEEHDEL